MKCMSAFIRRYHKPKTIAFLGQRSRRPFHDWITIDTQCCIFLTTKEGNDLILIDRSFRGRLDRRHSFKPGIASERAKHRLKIITFARTFCTTPYPQCSLCLNPLGKVRVQSGHCHVLRVYNMLVKHRHKHRRFHDRSGHHGHPSGVTLSATENSWTSDIYQ
jgi:hypothetical protein